MALELSLILVGRGHRSSLLHRHMKLPKTKKMLNYKFNCEQEVAYDKSPPRRIRQPNASPNARPS